MGTRTHNDGRTRYRNPEPKRVACNGSCAHQFSDLVPSSEGPGEDVRCTLTRMGLVADNNRVARDGHGLAERVTGNNI